MTTPKFRRGRLRCVGQDRHAGRGERRVPDLWTGSAPLVHVSAKQDIPTQQLADAFNASRAVAVAAPKESAAQAFAYDSFGKTGTVAADKRIADLGVRHDPLCEQRPAQHQEDRLRSRQGPLHGAPRRRHARPSEGRAGPCADDDADLGRGRPQEALARGAQGHARRQGRSPSAPRSTTMPSSRRGTTTPQDLALQMKVSAAYLLDPGFRPEAAANGPTSFRSSKSR